jgi:hypothetical protein
VAFTGRKHDLKCWPEPFAAIRAGLKHWELRLNDRDYQVGDLLWQKEWDPASEQYTGEATGNLVIWMLKGPAFGLPEGYCIMSLDRNPARAHPSGAEAPSVVGARLGDENTVGSDAWVERFWPGADPCKIRDQLRAALSPQALGEAEVPDAAEVVVPRALLEPIAALWAEHREDLRPDDDKHAWGFNRADILWGDIRKLAAMISTAEQEGRA